MAFQAKTDYFGLSGTALQICGSSDGKTAQSATAMDQEGNIIAREVYGETMSPSCDYKVKAAVNTSAVLGGVTTVESNKIVLGSLTINTGADVEPTVQASGEQVHSTATVDCKYTVSLAGLTTRRHAQKLFGAWGTAACTGDAKLNTANYTVSCAIGKATVNGDCVAFDVTQGTITCTLTFVQHGATKPSFTVQTGWKITSPLACSSPDASYPTWTLTMVKDLTLDVSGT